MLRCTFLIVTLFAALMLAGTGCSDSNPIESSEDHFEAIGLFVFASGDTIVKYQGGIVTGQIEVEENDETALLSIKFIEEDGEVRIPPTADWSLSWDVADTSFADVEYHQDELVFYHFNIMGKKSGQTDITIIINHFDHKDFESKEIPIVVSSPE
jgi:hypothetical protein